jgi:hypothetical protein
MTNKEKSISKKVLIYLMSKWNSLLYKMMFKKYD